MPSVTGLYTVNARLLMNGGGFRLSSYEARFVKETELRKTVPSWLGSNTTVQQKHTCAHTYTVYTASPFITAACASELKGQNGGLFL